VAEQVTEKLPIHPVHRRDDYICQYCGKDGLASLDNWGETTIDHVVPKKHGGTDDQSNLVTSCSYCNAIKGQRFLGTIEEARDYVLKRRGELRETFEKILIAIRGRSLECLCDMRRQRLSGATFYGKGVEKMGQIIAICGLVCADCPAFIATEKDDDEEKKRIAEVWSTSDYPLEPGDINCDGCLAVRGSAISFCEDCDVRQCGVEKGVENYAYCEGYPSERLDKIFNKSPEAKATLKQIGKSHQI